jgi:hypothetical protein
MKVRSKDVEVVFYVERYREVEKCIGRREVRDSFVREGIDAIPIKSTERIKQALMPLSLSLLALI